MRWGRIQHEACDSSTRLVFASLPDLRLETGLDRVDGPSRAARLARHEEYTVLLRENSVWRFARLAGHVLDWNESMSVSAHGMLFDGDYRCIDAIRAQFAFAGSDP